MVFEKWCVVATDHPSLVGHFPGHPITPGVVILDEVIQALTEEWPGGQSMEIPLVKFLAPLRPGQPFTVRLRQSSSERVQFECIRDDGQLLAHGYLLLVDSVAG
ncbi:MAG: hydroxymyristoyl-ACP dehydratase [Gammaproteobacteria bacterium]|nr:hydroxymyristoyl-ACP dehydratase [Gammaproteobacteria bacterium]